jgi:hypothetical protein
MLLWGVHEGGLSNRLHCYPRSFPLSAKCRWLLLLRAAVRRPLLLCRQFLTPTALLYLREGNFNQSVYAFCFVAYTNQSAPIPSTCVADALTSSACMHACPSQRFIGAQQKNTPISFSLPPDSNLQMLKNNLEVTVCRIRTREQQKPITTPHPKRVCSNCSLPTPRTQTTRPDGLIAHFS